MSDVSLKRPLREGEALCKHGCRTIVEAAVGDCGMCCEEAVAARTARVAPLDAAQKAKNHEETEAWVSRRDPQVYESWKSRVGAEGKPKKGKG